MELFGGVSVTESILALKQQQRLCLSPHFQKYVLFPMSEKIEPFLIKLNDSLLLLLNLKRRGREEPALIT